MKEAIDRLKDSADTDALDIAWWEMALLRFSPVPGENGQTHYEGGPYEPFAQRFGLTETTVTYARERSDETRDLILRLHYLAFVVQRMPQTGKIWVDRQRTLLELWRQYVDECRAAVKKSGKSEHVGLYIEHALRAISAIVKRPGILQGDEAQGWVAWVLQLAHEVRDFPGNDAEQRHRWVAPYLQVLVSFPPWAADAVIRSQTITLLDDAAAYYASDPLADDFSRYVSRVRYELTKHWGDRGGHRAMILEQHAALLRRARLHKDTQNGLLAQHFFREAQRLAQEHTQYFSASEMDQLMSEERRAIERAIQGGEFKAISARVELPSEQVVRVRGTPEETVAALVHEVAIPVPSRERLEQHARRIAAEAPLSMTIGRTVIAEGKVVAESHDEGKNLELLIERCAILEASIAGQVLIATIAAAAAEIGLALEHLMDPLTPLALGHGTMEMISRGCERLISGDFTSACHILVPRVEDVLRQHLRARGLHATEFRRDVGDGTGRTDDEPLGSMLARCLPDSRTVRDYLGQDFAEHIERAMISRTGLNLRNVFAHGLARPGHCIAANAGIVLGILYGIASVAKAHGEGGGD